MTTVRFAEPEIDVGPSVTTVRMEVDRPDRDPMSLWYELPAVDVSRQQCIDAAFVVGRLVALRRGSRLILPGPVSGRLLDGAEHFQDLYLEWFPRSTRPLRLDAERADGPRLPAERGAISTFTGGVDSYYTVLENLDALTAVVFVHGLDIGLHATEFRSMVAAELAMASAELGLPLWEVRTNVRRLTNPYASWGQKAHGSILASVGILLAQQAETLYIPSSLPRGSAIASGWGSHVLSDRLHSTDYLTVVHHGVDTSRPAKTARVAESDSALRHLRVCYTSRTEYNCGHCSKCRRTMIDLELAGVEDVGRVFADPVPIAQVLREFTVTGMIADIFARSSIVRAREIGRRDIAKGLRRAVRAHELDAARSDLRKQLPHLRKDPEFLRIVGPLGPPADPPPPSRSEMITANLRRARHALRRRGRKTWRAGRRAVGRAVRGARHVASERGRRM